MKPISLTAIESMDVIRMGLQTLPTIYGEVVGSVQTLTRAAEVDLTRPRPDVVLIDLWTGEAGDELSLPWISRFREWDSQVVVYTAERRPHLIQRALRAGAVGVVAKDAPLASLVNFLEHLAVGAGPFAGAPQCLARLTRTEQQVLRLIAVGLSSAEVASWLVVSPRTVDTHLGSILRKYSDATASRVRRAGMLRLASQDGYTDPRLLSAEEATLGEKKNLLADDLLEDVAS